MHSPPLKKFLVCTAVVVSGEAWALPEQPPKNVSRVAPETAFPNFWEGFTFGFGVYSDNLSTKNRALYNSYPPGVQLSVSQHLRSMFSGTISLRGAYWQEKSSGNELVGALIPLSLTSRIDVLPPLENYLGATLGNLVRPFVCAGPGGVFFTSPQKRDLPGRSYTIEAGAGLYFIPRNNVAIRFAYHYWKSASSLGLKSGITSVELHVGDFGKN